MISIFVVWKYVIDLHLHILFFVLVRLPRFLVDGKSRDRPTDFKNPVLILFVGGKPDDYIDALNFYCHEIPSQ